MALPLKSEYTNAKMDRQNRINPALEEMKATAHHQLKEPAGADVYHHRKTEFEVITTEVVEFARDSLVIGIK